MRGQWFSVERWLIVCVLLALPIWCVEAVCPLQEPVTSPTISYADSAKTFVIYHESLARWNGARVIFDVWFSAHQNVSSYIVTGVNYKPPGAVAVYSYSLDVSGANATVPANGFDLSDPLAPNGQFTYVAISQRLPVAVEPDCFTQAVPVKCIEPLSLACVPGGTLQGREVTGIVMHGVPSSPRNVVRTILNDTAAMFEWDAPADDGSTGVLGMDVKYSVKVDGVTVAIGIEQRHFVLAVNRGETVSVTIGAENSFGLGSFSSPIQVRALRSANAPSCCSFSANPLGSVEDAENQKVRVAWGAPTDLGAGAGEPVDIATYEVSYKKCSGGTCEVPRTFQTSALSYDVEGLDHGADYEFSVRVFTRQDVALGAFSGVSVNSTLVHSHGTRPIVTFTSTRDGCSLVNNECLLLFGYPNTPVVVRAAFQDVDGGALSFESEKRALSGNNASWTIVDGPDGRSFEATMTPSEEMTRENTTLSVCVVATDETGLKSVKDRCVMVRVVRPTPVLSLSSARSAVVGCPMVVGVTAHDETEEGLSIFNASSLGYLVKISVQSWTQIPQGYGGGQNYSVLQGGMSFVLDTSNFSNRASGHLEWTPTRGQEGFDYRVCFNVESIYGGRASDFGCVIIAVKRCRVCVDEDSTLFDVALAWHGAWTDIFAGNHNITDSRFLQPYQEVMLGPVALVNQGNTLHSMARRYGVSVDMLLAWNPDVRSRVESSATPVLFEEQELCVIVRTCVRG